jgi:uncharacterized protein YndB with AHSA1/START domain
MTELGIVEVSVHVAAMRENVFPYFTDPARHVEWMGKDAKLEPVSYGLYCLQLGDGFGVSGTFLEVEPPRRLVFTWGWAQGAGQAVLSGPRQDDVLPSGSTRVVVTLNEDDGGTRLTLRHHGLPTDELRDGHRVAWETYLDRLGIRSQAAILARTRTAKRGQRPILCRA